MKVTPLTKTKNKNKIQKQTKINSSNNNNNNMKTNLLFIYPKTTDVLSKRKQKQTFEQTSH